MREELANCIINKRDYTGITVADDKLAQCIWENAKLEGIDISLEEVKEILTGKCRIRMAPNIVVTMYNLTKAWEFILGASGHPTDYNLTCKINQLVGEAYLLRNAPLSMEGTAWKPAAPVGRLVKKEMEELLTETDPKERAITYMLYLMRNQLFVARNTTTAILAANHCLLAHGYGVVSIPVELQGKFQALLTKFCETNDAIKIKQFIYDCCIDEIQQERPSKQMNLM